MPTRLKRLSLDLPVIELKITESQLLVGLVNVFKLALQYD